MKTLQRGKVAIDSLNQTTYSSQDGIHFVNEKGDELPPEDYEEWAILLNSPWSQKDEHYTVEVNCKDAYTEIEEGAPIWRCLYEVVGYEMIYSSCIGYGNTPAEALADCQKLFDYLQENYNKEDESI